MIKKHPKQTTLLTGMFWAVLILITLLAWQQMNVAAATRSDIASALQLSPPGGYYADSIRVTLDTAVPATILYTRNGQEPTSENGVRYTGPISLDSSTPQVAVIRARQQFADGKLGPVVEAVYAVGIESDLPLLSLRIEPEHLWDTDTGIIANPFQKGIAWERPVRATFMDSRSGSGFALPAGVRIHGGYTRTYDKKSFRLYFRRDYGAGRLEYPLFGADTAVSEQLPTYNQLVIHSGGQDSPQPTIQWALMRSQLVAQLAFAVDGYATRSRPVLLFINGEPWGIYYLRERINNDFLADNYHVEQADLLDTPHLAETAAPVAGSRAHWDHLVTFLQTHDLNDPAHYAYVKTQVNVPNFIDYTLLQIYAANYDWPQHNVNLFRSRVQGGRWQFLFWDNDFGFALDSGSQVDLDMMNQALKLNRENRLTREDTLLLRKLLENPSFEADFLRRTDELLNDTLQPESVIAQIDALAAALAGDIAYEAGGWSSQSVWEANTNLMRSFAVARPGYVRQHMIDYFELPGTAVLTFQPPAAGAGHIAVNGRILSALPRQSTHFQTTTLRITAVPDAGYQFVGWAENDALPAAFDLKVETNQTLTPIFAPANQNQPQPGDVIIEAVHVDDNGQIEGDWLLLRVQRDGVDMRGWRLTDNDHKQATDEGSLILPNDPMLANLNSGTSLLVAATATTANDAFFATAESAPAANQIVFYAGHGRLDSHTDPWFNLSTKDNLVLLAPGQEPGFEHEVGIDFVTIGLNTAVTSASFGILQDGVMARTITIAEEQP